MDKSAFKGCKKDTRFFKHDFTTYGRKDIFDSNSVPYDGLPAYVVNNDHKFHKFTRSIISWTPQCKSLVGEMIDQEAIVKKLEKSVNTCKAFAWVSLALCLIFGLIELQTMCEKKRDCAQAKLFFTIPKLLMFVLHAIFLLVLLGRGKEIEGVYGRLANENCSDEFTNDAFKGFDKEITKHCINRAIVGIIVVLVVVIYNFITESICHCQWLITCKWVMMCNIWKKERQLDERRQERISHVRNPTMGYQHAPSLATRK